MPAFQKILGHSRAKKKCAQVPHMVLIAQCLLTATVAIKNYDDWRELECFSQNECLLCKQWNFCCIMCENPGGGDMAPSADACGHNNRL